MFHRDDIDRFDSAGIRLESERPKESSRQLFTWYRGFIVVGCTTHRERLIEGHECLSSAHHAFVRLGRPSVLFRDDQRASNGGDAVIDMGADTSFNSSFKQQLQVIDATVGR